MENKKDLITWKLQQLYILHSFLKKEKPEKKIFEENFLDFKLKILHDKKYFEDKKIFTMNMYLDEIIKGRLKNKKLFKLIYNLNFQDKIDQHQFSRSTFNILENINLHNTIINDNTISENSALGMKTYKNTLNINNMYYLYKIKNNKK